MVLDVSIKVKKGDMARVKKLLAKYPKKAPVVLSRAINKTTDTVRVKAVREIAQNTKLKKSDIFKKSGGRPVKQTKANRNRLAAEIQVTGQRIPLSRFKARQTIKGVSYDLGRGRTKIKSAFMQEVFGKGGGDGEAGAGHIAVLMRKGKARHPLRELFGPSILQVFIGSAKIIKKTTKEANKLLPKNINTQIKLMLEKQSR